MKKHLSRRSLSFLAEVLLIIVMSVPVFGDTYTGIGGIEESSITVKGTVSALTISVTHPTSVNWAIEPNLPTPFIVPMLQIINNTICPIVVAVDAFGKNAAGSSLPFTDVAPTVFSDWSDLSTASSKANLALGIKIHADGSDWEDGYNTETRWAYQTGVHTHFGTLSKDAVGILDFEARHGLSFDTSYTAQHDLVFVFTLN